MSTSILTQEMTLGPLTGAQREDIMRFATSLSAEGRRTFRRLLILAQPRGLSSEAIARAASQASEHGAR
jgi:hypothetical protein